MCQFCLLSLAVIGDLSRCSFVQFDRAVALIETSVFHPLVGPEQHQVVSRLGRKKCFFFSLDEAEEVTTRAKVDRVTVAKDFAYPGLPNYAYEDPTSINRPSRS